MDIKKYFRGKICNGVKGVSFDRRVILLILSKPSKPYNRNKIVHLTLSQMF